MSAGSEQVNPYGQNADRMSMQAQQLRAPAEVPTPADSAEEQGPPPAQPNADAAMTPRPLERGQGSSIDTTA